MPHKSGLNPTPELTAAGGEAGIFLHLATKFFLGAWRGVKVYRLIWRSWYRDSGELAQRS